MNCKSFTSLSIVTLCSNPKNTLLYFCQCLVLLGLLFFSTATLSAQGTFFVSSNTQQAIGVFDVTSDGFVTESTFRNITTDADGIFYDEASDVLYQLNRNNGAVTAYSNVKANLNAGDTPNIANMSAAESINGREIAVSGSRLVVAQDASDANGNQNRLIVFDISPTSITLAARYDVDFNLWGIHADGETLYAVEDNSNRLAVFENFFFLPEGDIFPTHVITVEGITRTHGLTYIADRDLMILTDIGDAANANDGAISVITNFKSTITDGIITADEQLRIEGSNTFLGNPVDVAFDANRSMIFVVERANGGGRVLNFTLPTADGNVAPNYNYLFAGASAIHFPGTENFQENMATRLAQLFVSSNTQQQVGVFNIWNDNSIAIDKFNNVAQDADGIYYDRSSDVLYQLNRMNNSINAFSNVNASINQNVMPPLTASSSAEFVNGREIAIFGNKLVVAQSESDANGNQNQFVWFDITPNSITFIDRLVVDFPLWGIHADGSTLYAVEDKSNRLAVFEDFFNQSDQDIQIPFFVEIEGLVRTHGLTYVADRDMMILTDIGAASSADDGAFVIIKNFKAASADGIVSSSEQIRVEGSATFLGNPVDIAFEPTEMKIYVAERANGSGRVLAFAMPSMSGNYRPIYNNVFPGASAVYLSSDNGMGGPNPPSTAVADRFFVSSNTQRVIATYNIQADNSIMKQQFANGNEDADGIYYDNNSDILYQVNRTGNAINAFADLSAALDQGIMPRITASSAAEFSNGREIAASGNWLLVVQDASDANGNQDQFVIFDKNTLALKRKFEVDFPLWGVHAVGSTVYAVEDVSNRLAIYEDFFNQLDNDIQLPFVVSVEGLVRTHGLTYDASRDRMFLTDIGAASSADDGAFIVINNFTSASADGTISSSEQIRIEGSNTFLGNPVDIAYDGQRNRVYIAERANGGGRVLGFDLPTASGNVAPLYNDLHAGASAIYFADGDGNNFVPTIAENFDPRNLTETQQAAVATIKVYPNPAQNYLTVELPDFTEAQSANMSIYIMDNFGRQIRKINPFDERQDIDISDLVDGVYYMMMTKDGVLSTQKFIKTVR